MKFGFLICSVSAALSLASFANASVVTYTFATGNQQVGQGATYCPTYSTPAACSSKQTVSVFAEQTNSSGNFVTPVTTGPWWAPQSTESGLFTVIDTPNDRGTGIAPYNPSDGSSGAFDNQQGITDSADNAHGNGNILLLELSDFPANSTLSLLLQAGVTGDSFTIYTSTGPMPTSLSGMTKYDSTPINVDEGGNSQPNTPQLTGLTISGLNPGSTGWIAIQADCHYLLLDTLTVDPPSVPEPRFYGIVLAGFLGLAGMVYNKRRRTQVLS